MRQLADFSIRFDGIAMAILAALVLAPAKAEANWIDKFAGAIKGDGAKHLSGSLAQAAANLSRLPAARRNAALAAAATHEGHWRFVNGKGETYTAGSPEELARAVSTLLPDASASGPAVTLILSQDTVFSHAAQIKDLPAGASLRLAVGKESLPLTVVPDGAKAGFMAEVRPNLGVGLSDMAGFQEAMWHLIRPLRREDIRVLSLQPGGAHVVPHTPRIDKDSGRAMSDTVDPFALTRSMYSLRRQSALITGRIKGEFLYFKPSGGQEGAVKLAELRAEALDSDVNLIVMDAASPRQPGARNWLWQRAAVKGLDDALKRATWADFLNALAGPGGRLEVAARQASPLRVELTAAPAPSSGAIPSADSLSKMVTDAVSDLTGDVVIKGVQASLRSRQRQAELDLRLVPGIPSLLQFAYLALALAGLAAFPVARSWWRRLWPKEQRGEYRNWTGFLAARAVRGAAFLLAFLPLSAPAALPVFLLTLPRRLRRWRHRAASAG